MLAVEGHVRLARSGTCVPPGTPSSRSPSSCCRSTLPQTQSLVRLSSPPLEAFRSARSRSSSGVLCGYSMQNVFVGAIGHGDLGCLCTTTTEHSLYNWGLTKKKRHRTLLCETGESGSMSEQPLTGAAATITHAPAYSPRARTRVHPLCYTSVASRTSLSKILSGIVRRGSYRRSVVKGVLRVSWSLEANSSNS